MPTTDVGICKLGCAIIGAQTIVSLAQPKSASEIRCALFYPQRRDAELRKYRWNFAKRWQVMNAPDPSVVHPRLAHAYLLPANPWCLRVIRRSPVDNWPVDWEIAGRHLYTDFAPGWTLPFIARVPEAEFDPLFVDVLAASMAVVLTEPTTQSNSKQVNAREVYRMAVAAARAANSFEVEPEQDLPDEWERSRY